MSDVDASVKDDELIMSFDDRLYPKDAVYGAAYIFIDRCYVHLDRDAPDRISVRLKRKPDESGRLEDLAGEFENELLGQAWRRLIIDDNRQLIEEVSAGALAGAAGPTDLDDLLAVDIDESSAFDDPLGIAQSWEEKYKKTRPSAGPTNGGEENVGPEPTEDGERK